MILTPRTALVRNVLVSGTNGAITLVILLIAPLGLAAVIINTVLVTVATFTTSQAADRVIRFLQGRQTPQGSTGIEVLPDAKTDQLQRRS
ncbi:MAG: CRISPR-associated protein Csx18 [Cyanobacteria bacterium LVE1205-1]|jgi:hypothetical protein